MTTSGRAYAVKAGDAELTLISGTGTRSRLIARLAEGAEGLEVREHGPLDNLTIRDANAVILTVESVRDTLMAEMQASLSDSPSP